MRRFLINGLLFLCAGIVIYTALFTVLCRIEVGGIPVIYRTSEVLNWKGGNSFTKFTDFDREGQYDVLFIGSSHAYRGYDTEVFMDNGYSAFNLGSSAQTPRNSFEILEHLVTDSNTKMVIVDVFLGALETDGLESTADLTQNYPSWAPVVDMVFELKDPRGLNMLMLRALRSKAEPMYAEECTGRNGTCLIADSIENVPELKKRPMKIVPEQLGALKGCIEYLQAKGVTVVLVDHPVPMRYFGEMHEQYANEIKELAMVHGLSWIDMTRATGYDDNDHFYDHTHLNAAGARKFSRELLQILVDRGIL